MNTKYHVKLIQEGNTQTLTIPPELSLSTTEVIIREEDGKLIIEPYKKKSLLEIFATLDDIEEDFPDVDAGLLPLDDIQHQDLQDGIICV
ncbi:antitoxin [Anabaena lutea]|uniref:AbrB/MazE/SpoVT family DNA-binding domain-containing protein n=1 Tax=Anabaena lutea FACHB-196 TaxID=2692881 RepID=A0ABR8FM63_9NOST|nr:AbrB/MazE/SpoVT family DNA-binding domain-containing protein [Anabaena lutea]MBD2569786.1 AbrB/MazE/SpoVT family DNA-binding domain-containing protein [Anabaena lutea FACHB-196]